MAAEHLVRVVVPVEAFSSKAVRLLTPGDGDAIFRLVDEWDFGFEDVRNFRSPITIEAEIS